MTIPPGWDTSRADTPPGHTTGLSWCYRGGPEEVLEPTQGQTYLSNRHFGMLRAGQCEASSAWVLLKAEAGHQPGALSAGEGLATLLLSSVFQPRRWGCRCSRRSSLGFESAHCLLQGLLGMALGEDWGRGTGLKAAETANREEGAGAVSTERAARATWNL